MLAIHIHEAGRQHAAFIQAQLARRNIEALFAELKNRIGVRRVRLRRLRSSGPG